VQAQPDESTPLRIRSQRLQAVGREGYSQHVSATEAAPRRRSRRSATAGFARRRLGGARTITSIDLPTLPLHVGEQSGDSSGSADPRAASLRYADAGRMPAPGGGVTGSR
jgi:hypothetical protein